MRATAGDPAAFVAPAGWRVVLQAGDCLGSRLANAFTDTAMLGTTTLLIGMDTPQATTELLTEIADRIGSPQTDANGQIDEVDAVLAPALDGGWWALALREPAYARVLAGVPTSTESTAADTLIALRNLSLTVAIGPSLGDVDTAADAIDVAAECPDGSFAAAVRMHLGTSLGARV